MTIEISEREALLCGGNKPVLSNIWVVHLIGDGPGEVQSFVDEDSALIAVAKWEQGGLYYQAFWEKREVRSIPEGSRMEKAKTPEETDGALE